MKGIFGVHNILVLASIIGSWARCVWFSPVFPKTCQAWLDHFFPTPYHWIVHASYCSLHLYSMTYWHQETVACKRTFHSLDPLLSLSSFCHRHSHHHHHHHHHHHIVYLFINPFKYSGNCMSDLLWYQNYGTLPIMWTLCYI